MYLKAELEGKGVKELLVIAKDLQITGRHDMKKAQLVDAIISRQNAMIELDNKIEADGGPINYSGVADISKVKKDIAEEKGCPDISDTVQAVQKDIESELAQGANEQWDGAVNPNMIQRIATEYTPKSKAEYMKNVKAGDLVAFKIAAHKAISGMIEEVRKDELVIKAKDGVCFKVLKANVIWVKTGPKWPRGIYLALKGDQAELNKTGFYHNK